MIDRAPPTEVRRIYVVGGPGSGKSTLAGVLGERFGMPVYDLVVFAHDGGAGAKVPLARRVAAARRITAEPGWIAEGIHLGWTDDLLREADLIVWFDLPRRIALWRIVVRHARASRAGTNRYPGLARLRGFLRSASRYWDRQDGSGPPPAADDDAAIRRESTAHTLVPYPAKVVRPDRPSAVAAWLHRLPPSANPASDR